MDPKPASDSKAVLVRWMGIGDANAALLAEAETEQRGEREAERRRENRLAEREQILGNGSERD